ncbi:hypothetical protein MUK42_33334 [Musa troglodytarum]|uniref:Uncharacterized protein n=1 Tax=Musa troglodytarum TaxID=320322 RepID=A0A9E7KWM3_9LILI|nr:hypothetical protein MUK42_33334 [Musa troglodytarum]
MNSTHVIHATEPKKALVHLCQKLATESKDEDGMKRVAVADLCFLGKRSLRSFVTPLTEELQQRRGSPRISPRRGAAKSVSPPQEDEQNRK